VYDRECSLGLPCSARRKFAVRDRHREWLFGEHVLTGHQRQARVTLRLGGDYHDIDPIEPRHSLKLVRLPTLGIQCLRASAAARPARASTNPINEKSRLALSAGR
jgi:hypothetical protein